ncbi:MAG: 1-acyl-sn-glycerol-3-phosphate acyltransferase [Christensenellaceae bacterium]|nr:1-acyl-sn-glycerol-3-phosphate acyltransferase [Christensenellaceae bacterium]
MTKEELFRAIEERERAGEFDVRVVPTPENKIKKVKAGHKFIRRGPLNFLSCSFWRGLVITAGYVINFFGFGLKIKGRKNLKGLKSAIILSNHVHDLDNCMIRQAVAGHKLYITAGEFNNRKGWFGHALRSGGLLPFSADIHAMHNLGVAIDFYLKKNCYVLFYPEEALWHRYQKPRPHKKGAYHYAVKSGVPVVPAFIEWGRGKNPKKATVHIMQPIYPDDALERKARIKKMKDAAYGAYVAKYEEVYGKKLEYSNGSRPENFLENK